MEALESLRRRLKTMHDLRAVVRTMKALSAAGMRQSESAVAAVAHYDQVLERALQAVLRDHLWELDRRRHHRRWIGVIVLGTDHGMCGPFNDLVADVAVQCSAEADGEGTRTTWWAVGRRLEGRLLDRRRTVEQVFETPASASVIGEVVEAMLVHLDRWRLAYDPGEIHVCHQAVRDGTETPRYHRIFPADDPWLRRLVAQPWATPMLPMLGGRWRDLYAAFVRQHLYVTLYRALAESLISEQTARLRAMQVAERNLDDMLQALETELHATRQSTITAELLDVVGGFEALESAHSSSASSAPRDDRRSSDSS